jgi:putative hydrolase of the HAD superfamily
LKALAFDLGDTLVEYEGLPPSWEAHYPDAIANLAETLGLTLSPAEIRLCSDVLRKYNTRLVPREVEVGFAQILSHMLAALGQSHGPDELRCATSFFAVFRQRLRPFPDALNALVSARARGLRIGVFSDVPYGMPRALVEQDIEQSGLSKLIDVMLTSRDAGFRKPSRRTLEALATALNCNANELAYVGNERKDVNAALALGCQAILLDRAGQRPAWSQHRTITSLSEL